MTYLQGVLVSFGEGHQATLISFIKPRLYHRLFKCVCLYILSVFLKVVGMKAKIPKKWTIIELRFSYKNNRMIYIISTF